MDPATINLALMGVEFLVKEAPEVAAELKSLFSKTEPTPADWNALRARVLAKSYEQLVPNSALNAVPPAQA
jgi:hypothetical protein